MATPMMVRGNAEEISKRTHGARLEQAVSCGIDFIERHKKTTPI
jgi:hypothetical protein